MIQASGGDVLDILGLQIGRDLEEDGRQVTPVPAPVYAARGNAEQAYARLRAGASLIQLYSALVYEGPYLARRINAGLKKLMARDGFTHISEVIGIDS